MEIWGNGSGAALALTTGYVAGDEVAVATENELWLVATLSATAVTAADLDLQVSFDAGVTWTSWPLPVVALDGTQPETTMRAVVPPFCTVRLRAKRRGGDATSALLVTGWLRSPTAQPDPSPRVTNKAIALDATSDTPAGAAGAGLLLDLALEYGEWFNTGDGDMLELIVTKTTANTPTSMHIEIQRREGAVGHPTDCIDAVSAGDVTHSAAEIKATDISATTPLYRLYRAEVTPRTWVRVGARYVGGTSPTVLILARVTRR